jgi:hypothetical protein
MNKLNEGIEDLLGGNIKSNVPNIDDILSSITKKIKKVSIFNSDDDTNDIKEEIPVVSNETTETPIVISKPIAEEYETSVMEEITQIDKAEEIRAISVLRTSKKNKKLDERTIEEIEKDMLKVRKELEIIYGEELPKNINVIEAEQEITNTLSELPGAKNLDITDIDIKAIPTKKDKSGYFKTKLSTKIENYPEILLEISSYVKKRSNGVIFPRKVDLRVLANTNKTQLRNSPLKLNVFSVVFKPDFNKLKVNKGTRFMISVPENYSSTGNIIIYIQESRNKKILEISPNDFQKNEDNFKAFIGDRIVEYFVSGYDLTIKKIEFRSVNNPLMQIITDMVATHDYKAIPYLDDNSHIYLVDFYSKGVDNQWLYIQIKETQIPGKYDIIAKNKVDDDWQYAVSTRSATISDIRKNLQQVLETCFGRVWNKELNVDDDMRFYYLYDKLSHAKLKNAMADMYDFIEAEKSTENEDFQDKKIKINLIIKETLSKIDTRKALNNKDYDSEAIIGKTDFIDYFILSFLAYPIISGDKRKGSDYITSDEYKEKYKIKEGGVYQERKNTILKNEGVERNYNSRPYLFQIEYSVGDKKHIYRNLKWSDLLTETGIFTNIVKFPQTKF